MIEDFGLRIAEWKKRGRRGSVLIVTIGVLAILTALVLTLGRSMRVEAITSANYAGTVKAEGIEQAGEQYAMAQLVGQPDEADEVMTLDPSNFMAIPVGDAGYFWIIRPNYDDPTMQSYGLMDESGKLNINSTAIATEDGLMMLPGMTQDMADALIDWVDDNDEVTGSGAESSTYLMLPNPYMAKNGPMESVEELLLVQGFTREYLYGNQMASGHFIPYDQSGGMTAGDSSSADVDPTQYRGIYDYLTVFSTASSSSQQSQQNNNSGGSTGGKSSGSRSQVSAGGGKTGGTTGGNTGTTPVTTGTTTATGLININTAPREVLLCLPGLTDSDVDAMITQRASAVLSDPIDNTWAQTILAAHPDLRTLVTYQSYQYSADIVAVSANGRAFKRVRVVIDIQSGTPKIIFRRDMTEFGWPLDPAILESLRGGNGVPGGSGTMDSSRRSS